MPDPNCTLCDGTGWRPVERGEVSGVERCECDQAARPKHLLHAARIPPRFEHASFENFSVRRDNPLASDSLSRAIVDARAFAREYPVAEKAGVLFMGGPGAGKTHLATAVLKTLVERGFEGIFLDYQNLLDSVQASYDPAVGAAAREAYQAALDTEIVLLDDLGARRVSDWAEDTIFAIINHRYNGRKATIVTTNLPDPAFGDVIASRDPVSSRYTVKDTLADRIGVRARSRLFEMCRVVRISADDYRLRGVR